VVAGSEIVRRVLVPVYRALDLEWRPETAGALSDAAPMVDVGAVTAAISAEIEDLAKVEESNVDAETMELAHRFASDHLVAGTARRPL
jgi:phage baseplate assembly protein W